MGFFGINTILCKVSRCTCFHKIFRRFTPFNIRYDIYVYFCCVNLILLHFAVQGVTHLPEVQSVDIMNVFSAIADSAMEGEPVETLCVVLASDGVWDNWQYEDVNAFVLDQSCVHAVMSSEEGAQRVAASFLYRNTIYAKRNFGSHADNATGIVLYLSCADQFPG